MKWKGNCNSDSDIFNAAECSRKCLSRLASNRDVLALHDSHRERELGKKSLIIAEFFTLQSIEDFVLCIKIEVSRLKIAEY